MSTNAGLEATAERIDDEDNLSTKLIYTPNSTTISITKTNGSNISLKSPTKDDSFLSAAIGSIQTLKSISPKRAQARTVLWYLVFCGFAMNYQLRLTANIAIVEMIAQQSSTINQKVPTSECLASDVELPINGSVPIVLRNIVQSDISSAAPNQTKLVEAPRFSLERALLDSLQVEYEKNGFHWNAIEQGRVLGSFYWMHWLTQLPGGILGRRYGSKLIFGCANFVGCFLGFFMPIAAYYDVNYFICLRVVQGMITGLSWPSMQSMTAQWIPPNERSHFVTAYLGGSVGTAVFFPIFGYILSYLSWEWVYHLSALMGTIWYCCWLYCVYDTPAKHPRIDPAERAYIEHAIGDTCKVDKKDKTPWRAILTSKTVWVIIIAQWGGLWGLFTMLTQAPTYFKMIHGWSVKTTGLMCGIPHIARMVFAYGFSTLGDWLLLTNRMSRTHVRKMAGSISLIVNGLFVCALAFTGCNAIMAIVLITLATASQGAVSTGPLANIIDISPNYSGVILGLASLITTVAGIISPYIVGKLTVGNQTLQPWQYVFLIAAATMFFCGLVYALFADAELQSWNNPQKRGVTKEGKRLLKNEINSEQTKIAKEQTM